MTKFFVRCRKHLAALALGGSTLALAGSPGGCRNGVIADVVGGIGNGAIASATDAVFGRTPQVFQDFAQTPATQGLQNAWSQWVQFQFPILTVRQQVFAQ